LEYRRKTITFAPHNVERFGRLLPHKKIAKAAPRMGVQNAESLPVRKSFFFVTPRLTEFFRIF
jgi:hypothetical protein